MHDYSKPCGGKKPRFREWLVKKLDEKQIPGVEWIDRTQGIFKIPWKHASRHNWSVSDDSEIFKQWAIYSGKYRDGEDTPNPSKWKTNFRCTLNALPYFKEITDRSCRRGPVAYRIYLLMPSTLKAVDKKSSKGREHSEETETPFRERLEWLSMKLTLWKPLARRLGFSEGEIKGFDKDDEELAEKALSMLLRWKQKKGSDATYAVLCAALSHEFVGRKDLAEEVIKSNFWEHQ